jgi:hypothetical protein
VLRCRLLWQGATSGQRKQGLQIYAARVS